MFWPVIVLILLENKDFLSVPRNNLIKCVMVLYYQRAGNIASFKADDILKSDRIFWAFAPMRAL